MLTYFLGVLTGAVLVGVWAFLKPEHFSNTLKQGDEIYIKAKKAAEEAAKKDQETQGYGVTGSTTVSKTVSSGSNPDSPAIKVA